MLEAKHPGNVRMGCPPTALSPKIFIFPLASQGQTEEQGVSFNFVQLDAESELFHEILLWSTCRRKEPIPTLLTTSCLLLMVQKMLNRATDQGKDALVPLLIAAELVTCGKEWGRCRWVSFWLSFLNSDSYGQLIRESRGEYKAEDVHKRSSQESYQGLQHSTSGFAPNCTNQSMAIEYKTKKHCILTKLYENMSNEMERKVARQHSQW